MDLLRAGTLLEAITLVTQFGLTLGKDCEIQFPGYNVAIAPQAITQFKGDRIDHNIILTSEQKNYLSGLGLRLEMDLTAAGDDDRKALAAYTVYQLAKAKLRDEIITPIAQAIDKQSPKSLIYTHTPTPFKRKSDCMVYPDGRSHFVHSLIHFSHPSSPEELWLREHRVNCRYRYRFHIVELDDAQWNAQNEPRQEMGDRVWRSVLGDRLR